LPAYIYGGREPRVRRPKPSTQWRALKGSGETVNAITICLEKTSPHPPAPLPPDTSGLGEGAGGWEERTSENLSDAPSGLLPAVMGNSLPGLTPRFVLARFQRSGRQPSQDIREDDQFGCI
jgi:hypothetical protein